MPAGPQPRALQGDPMSFTIAVGATTDEFVPFFRRSRKRVRCVRHPRYTRRATGFVLVFARDSEGERRDPFVPVVSSELKRSGGTRRTSPASTVRFPVSSRTLPYSTGRRTPPLARRVDVTRGETLAGREFVVADRRPGGVERSCKLTCVADRVRRRSVWMFPSAGGAGLTSSICFLCCRTVFRFVSRDIL